MNNNQKERLIKLASYTLEDWDETPDRDEPMVKAFAHVLAGMDDGSIMDIFTEIKTEMYSDDAPYEVLDEDDWYFDAEQTKIDESDNPPKVMEIVDVIEVLDYWKEI